jgi:hypothetical protein
VLTESCAVLALVPHRACEPWLDSCLESLVRQTRPLDGIAVIDDASARPPVDLVRRHPGVTLLRAADRAGPYRLVQQVIDDTAYDAFLFQDADDWSRQDRLEVLLRGAVRTGAELVGSQEVRILCCEREVVPIAYPLDVNASLAREPAAFALLHPTSLVHADLVRRLGGFATGLRFNGDAEFLARAVHAARVANVAEYLYFRRKRPQALTTAADTGLGTPARLRVQARVRERAEANARAVRECVAPDLTPLRVAPPVRLEHLVGPPLRARQAVLAR